MTPDELRSLADEATPGPWKAEQTRWAPHDNRWSYSGPELLDHDGRTSEADARLIALAPDLARLCAEQHEALKRIARAHASVEHLQEIADAALAKLSELKL